MHEGFCRRRVAAGFFLLAGTSVHAASPTHAALRDELLQMGARDQHADNAPDFRHGILLHRKSYTLALPAPIIERYSNDTSVSSTLEPGPAAICRCR